MANYHVSKNRETHKWDVQKEGGKIASGSGSTQKKAEKIAKDLSANSGGGEVRIHGLDGKIRDSDTVAPGHESTRKDTKH